MGGQSPAVCSALRDPVGLLGRCQLLGRGEASGLDLLGLFQGEKQLVLRQRLRPPSEAVALQFLDDLAQAVDLRVPRDQHRLERLGVTGELGGERSRNPQ